LYKKEFIECGEKVLLAFKGMGGRKRLIKEDEMNGVEQ